MEVILGVMNADDITGKRRVSEKKGNLCLLIAFHILDTGSGVSHIVSHRSSIKNLGKC